MNDLEAHQGMLGFSNVVTFLPEKGGCLTALLQYMEEQFENSSLERKCIRIVEKEIYTSFIF